MPGNFKLRILGVSCCLFSAFCWATNQAYLVKTKDNFINLDPNSKALSLQSLKRELLGGLRGLRAVHTFDRVNLLYVEGDKESLESALKNNPSVQYFEKEISWKVFASESPSSQDQSPWLKDVMKLGENDPSNTVEYLGSNPILVAIVDTGLNIDHPFIKSALSKNIRESSKDLGVDHDGNGYANDVYGANVFSNDGDVSESGTDHGTHVAGLVKIVRDQAIANYSQAAAVELLPIKFIDSSGSGSTSGAIAALEYAISRGARVVNASWGSTGAASYSQALYDAILAVYNQNIFISVAAGNSQGPQNNNDQNPTYPASFNIPGITSVASITPYYEFKDGSPSLVKLTLSPFSNFGPNSVDVAAPGDYRDANFNNDGVLSANANYPTDSNEFIKMRGTSMASPLVAGVAAVVRAINPNLTAYEVKKLIIDSSQKSPALSAIRSSAYVNAEAAFLAATTAISRGLHPQPSETSIPPAKETLVESKRLAGCGLIREDSKNQEGPMSGNSLGFFATAYFAILLIRKLKGQFLSLSV